MSTGAGHSAQGMTVGLAGRSPIVIHSPAVSAAGVSHSLAALVHVAIHKGLRVACRSWPADTVCVASARAACPVDGSAFRWGGGDAVDIRSAQKLAWENKLAKGFNTTDVPLEFCLLNGEIAEAFDAWRKGHPHVGEELADSAIFLLSLAEMIGTDLQNEVETKLAANEARVYRRLPNGVLVKDVAAGPPASG